ncbi:hypothetical protein PANO111632_11780 [Paracoccus nototheniae]|uniref:Flap endonuclease-1-like 5' DNA nuclease n=1 Tax=Paracoccus nototheniae TaxID=2489002 RepID=A0ABW4E3P1_9RHOB|nr:hypothetical protein [Paracoccus nototheniae]
MQGASKLTAAGAAVLVFLGLTLSGIAGWLVALVVAALVGGLLMGFLRGKAAPATIRNEPELRRVEPVATPVVRHETAAAPVPAPVMDQSPAIDQAPVDDQAPTIDHGRHDDSDAASRPPLFSAPGFGDAAPEVARFSAAERRIAPSGDAVPAPVQRDIPEAARSIYGDAVPDAVANPDPVAEAMADDVTPQQPDDVQPVQPAATVRTAANQTGAPDKLRAMRGLGLPIEKSLHAAGVTQYEQIAAWDDAEIDRVAAQIGYAAGRIRASNWVGQAQVLAERKRAGTAR